MKKISLIIVPVILIAVFVIIFVLYKFSIIPHKQYCNRDFNIETYTSNVDKDGDGIDDQTDILR